MKNRVVEIDDNVVALEIIYKGTRLLCYIDKVDLPKAALIRGTWQNVVDHIDHNTLNNVRNNLREVSKEQNAQNVSITLNSTTKCRNITIEDGKYRVRIGGHSFGRYNTLEEAQEVVRRERKNIFPLSSELDNKITI